MDRLFDDVRPANESAAAAPKEGTGAVDSNTYSLLDYIGSSNPGSCNSATRVSTEGKEEGRQAVMK